MRYLDLGDTVSLMVYYINSNISERSNTVYLLSHLFEIQIQQTIPLYFHFNVIGPTPTIQRKITSNINSHSIAIDTLHSLDVQTNKHSIPLILNEHYYLGNCSCQHDKQA